MRKFLAVWMSCLIMAGAAEAATVGNYGETLTGPDNLQAGTPGNFTLSYNSLGLSDAFTVINSWFTVNNTVPSGVGANPINPKGGSINFSFAFDPSVSGQQDLSVSGLLLASAMGSYVVSGGSVGNCAGASCGLYFDWEPSSVPVYHYFSLKATKSVFVEAAPSSNKTQSQTAVAAAVVPIAGALPLLLTGLGLLGWMARRRHVVVA